MWEVVGQLQDLDGAEEQRVSLLAGESDLSPRLARLALDYAAEHPDDVLTRVERNRNLAERSGAAARQRQALLR